LLFCDRLVMVSVSQLDVLTSPEALAKMLIGNRSDMRCQQHNAKQRWKARRARQPCVRHHQAGSDFSTGYDRRKRQQIDGIGVATGLAS